VTLTLAMDASAGPGSIAVLRDAEVLAARDVVMRNEAEERFFPAVLETLSAAGVTLAELDRLVVGAGPGSFTALRVVAATAKGIAQARALPVYAVPSLALIPTADATTMGEGTRWLATLDALRGERYAALVEIGQGGAVLRVEQLGLVPTAEVAVRAAELEASPIGPDETHAAAPHARGVARCLALALSGGAVSLASWEPTYGRLAEAQVKWEAAHGRPLG
jgi:tRNA threonylcarbamoyladenosine biosynthesis protein TsaB